MGWKSACFKISLQLLLALNVIKNAFYGLLFNSCCQAGVPFAGFGLFVKESPVGGFVLLLSAAR